MTMKENSRDGNGFAGYDIRRAMAADAHAMSQAEWSAAPTFASIPQLERLAQSRRPLRYWLDYLRSNDTCFVAVTATGDVVGFLCARPIDRHLHIDEVSVRQEWQQRGVGRRLVFCCLHSARAARAIGTTLTTYRDVPWNAPWYGRPGSPCARRKRRTVTPIFEERDVDRRTTTETRCSICPGCGAVLREIVGPTHPYMLSSPACFAAYAEVLACEYSDPNLMRTHRLTVDAFAVQHPGDGVSRQAIQSVGLHLAGLAIQLHRLRTPETANDIMLILGKHKAELKRLSPPKTFSMTVADILRFAGTPDHSDAVKAWAESAWQDWAEHHAYILDWAERYLGGSDT